MSSKAFYHSMCTGFRCAIFAMNATNCIIPKWLMQLCQTVNNCFRNAYKMLCVRCAISVIVLKLSLLANNKSNWLHSGRDGLRQTQPFRIYCCSNIHLLSFMNLFHVSYHFIHVCCCKYSLLIRHTSYIFALASSYCSPTLGYDFWCEAAFCWALILLFFAASYFPFEH